LSNFERKIERSKSDNKLKHQKYYDKGITPGNIGIYMFIAKEVNAIFKIECPDLYEVGYRPFKLGESGPTRKLLKSRLNSEFSAAMVKNPTNILFQVMPGLRNKDEDDRIRYYLENLEDSLFKATPLGFSEKMSSANGEFILINCSEILKNSDEYINELNNETIDIKLEEEDFQNDVASTVLEYIIKYIKQDNTDAKNLPYVPFAKQEYLMKQFNILRDKNVKAFLGWIATRSGKSLWTLSIAKIYNLTLLYIGKNLTSHSSVRKDRRIYFNDVDLLTQSINGEGEIDPHKVLKNFQDKFGKEPRNMMIVVDEAHEGSHTDNATGSLKKVVNLFEEHGYNLEIKISMSATEPEKIKKVLDAISTNNEPQGEIILDYTTARKIDPESTPPRDIAMVGYDDEGKYSFDGAMVGEDSNLKEDITVARKATTEVLDLFLGDTKIWKKTMKHQSKNKDYFLYLGFNNTNRLLSFINLANEWDKKDEYLFVPLVGDSNESNGISFEINNKIHTVFEHSFEYKGEELYEYTFVDYNAPDKIQIGDKIYKKLNSFNNKKAEGICKKIIDTFPEKKVVMVSNGMAVTSFSIKTIGRACAIAPNGISSTIAQVIGRATSKNNSDKVAQVIILTRNENRFKDVLDYENKSILGVYNSKEDRKSRTEVFIEDNGENCCIINSAGRKATGYDYGNDADLSEIIDKQMPNLASAINLFNIISSSQINFGAGTTKSASDLLKKNKGNKSIKTGFIDGNGDIVNNSNSSNSSSNNKNKDRLSVEQIKKMINGIEILPYVSKFFYAVDDVNNVFNNTKILSFVGLDQFILINEYKYNIRFKEAMDQYWVNMTKNTDSENKIIVQNILGSTANDILQVKYQVDLIYNIEDIKNANKICFSFSPIYWVVIADKIKEIQKKYPNIEVFVDISQNNYEDTIIDSIFGNINKININKDINMKEQFDYILTNPPYQGTNSSKTLWQEIMLKLYSITKPNGFIAAVHPGIWKSATNKIVKSPQATLDFKELMLKNEITNFHSHSTKEGEKVFGASTTFDYYIMQKKEKSKEKFEITTVSDGKIDVDIDELKAIPVSRIKEFKKLIGNDKLVINNDKISSTKISAICSSKYNKPVIMKLNIGGFEGSKDNLKYCEDIPSNQKIPKLIVSRGSTYTFLDEKGEYGSSVDGFYITDKLENLYKIQKVLDTSNDFRTLLSEISGSDDKRTLDPKRLSRSYIFEFKKDFWKDFYTDKMNNELINEGKINA